MLNHLAILQVIVPLLAAPISLLLNKARLAWLFACVATVVTFIISAALLYQVQQTGTITYDLGGWEAPWGIQYRIDLLAAYVLLVVSTIAMLVLFAAHTSISVEVPGDRQTLLYVLYLLCLAGLLGIVATGDIFNVFVFLEISSLASYALIAYGRDRRALWAAYQYLVVGTIGATFFLIGIGFLYSLTGTLNMADLAVRIPALGASKTLYTAFAFIVVGICLKLALFPLHLWLPNAYAYAPSIVTAFLAATATKGCRLSVDSPRLFGVWHSVHYFRAATAEHFSRSRFGGGFCRFPGCHSTAQYQASFCLFQCRSDRLHDYRHGYRHNTGAAGDIAASV